MGARLAWAAFAVAVGLAVSAASACAGGTITPLGNLDAGGDVADARAAIDSGGDGADGSVFDGPGPSDASGDDASDGAEPDGATCAVDFGLVGYWPFEEGSGTTTADVSGSGNAGTLTNSPMWSATAPPTPYANAHSLSFDGTSSYVTMGNPSALRLTGPMSLACWFQSSASLGNYQTLVSKWWSGDADAAYSIYWTTGFGPTFAMRSAMGSSIGASATTAFDDGAWHFVAATWTGVTVRLYVDAVEQGDETPDGSFGATADVMHPFDVATDDRYSAGTGDRFFPGLIDDVRVYDRPLTAAEIGKLFDGKCAAH